MTTAPDYEYEDYYSYYPTDYMHYPGAYQPPVYVETLADKVWKELRQGWKVSAWMSMSDETMVRYAVRITRRLMEEGER